MKFQIKSTGNTILASLDFVNAAHPNDWIEIPEEQVTAPVPRLISKIEFMDRFTEDELVAIYTAAKTDVRVEIWLEKFKTATEFNLDSENVKTGLQGLVDLKLLTSSRIQTLLT